MNLDEILSIIGKEGEPIKKDCIPLCFGTNKVLEVASDVQCLKCDDWKYRCAVQYKFGNILNLNLGSDNHQIEE